MITEDTNLGLNPTYIFERKVVRTCFYDIRTLSIIYNCKKRPESNVLLFLFSTLSIQGQVVSQPTGESKIQISIFFCFA